MQFKLSLEVPPIEKPVLFSANVIWDDDGIGSYEFWGSRGNDSRPFQRVDDNGPQWDRAIYTDAENAAISSYIDEYWEKLDEAFVTAAVAETE